MKNLVVELNPKILFFTLGIALALFLVVELKTVLIMLFVAFIINASLRPTVDKLQGHGWPRPLAIATIYILVILGFLLVIVFTANEFLQQVISLISTLPQIVENVGIFLQHNSPTLANLIPFTGLKLEASTYAEQVINSQFFKDIINGGNIITGLTQAVGIFGSIFNGFITVFTVVMVSVYMLRSKDEVYEGLLNILPEDMATSARHLLTRISVSLGSWLRGQLILMLVIGVMIYFVILLPGVFDPNYTLDNYALPIALAAALLEALPNLGPTITMLLALILALGTGATIPTIVYIFISFIAVQNVEGVFVVPVIMRKAVGIDPILTILGVVGAFEVAGVVGALLIIPVIAAIQIGVEEISLEYRRSHPLSTKRIPETKTASRNRLQTSLAE